MSDAVNMDDGQRELRLRLQSAVADRFTIGDAIGHGATSFVFAARDLQHFDREVAVKVIRPEVAEAVGGARFRREMRLAAQLTHPHILPLLDWGDADGLLYYVMPRVAGESLRSRLQREQQLALDDAVRITRDVAAALQHAHAQGIAHRDVKPENILLTDGQAILADFGLARVVDTGRGDSVTTTGVAVGTAAYMSPEQASGGPGDARSDQYSLACVLYEMLAGDPPFHASTVQALLARHRSDAVPHLTSVRPSLPAGVDEAVQRALAKVPADRFASAAFFALAVETALTGATLAAVQRTVPSTAAPVARWKTWGRMGMAAAAIPLAWALLKVFDVLPGDRATALDANRIVVAPFDVIGRTDTVWRFGLVHVFSRNLDGAGPIRAVPPNLVVRDWSGRSGDVSARQLGRQTGAGLVLHGQLIPVGESAVRVRVSLEDLTSDQNVADLELQGDASQVLNLADSVTILVLRGLARSRRIASVAGAGFLTRSLPALKAFLQGEQYYRANDFSVAKRYYEMAVAQDTAFAVAYRRLRGVHRALGGEADSLSLAYAKRAGDLNRGLGRRDSLLILADSLAAARPRSVSFFEVEDQQRLRRRIQALEIAVREYPTDADARMELAEAWYHAGDRVGVSRDQALITFEQAIVREPAFGPAYYHAIELALVERGADSARRILARYLTVLPADRRFQLIHSILSSESSKGDEVTRMLREVSPESLLDAAYVLRGSRPTGDRSELILRSLLARADVAGTDYETEARESLILLLLNNGRPAAAYDLARSGTALGALYIMAPLAQMDAIEAGVADSVLFPEIASVVRPRVLYALAWFGPRGNHRALSEFARRYPTTHSGVSTVPFRRYVAGAATAYRALAGADTASALDLFLALPDSLCSALCQPHRIRTAELLVSSGRPLEAAALLDRYPPPTGTPDDEPRWRMARAATALMLGDTATANREYARIAATFQPDNQWSRYFVAAARAALAKLKPPS